MKRPNRSGAVIKLGGKRRKPYAARITVGTYINSKGNVAQKFKYIGYFEKQAEALAALEKYNVTGEAVYTPPQEDKSLRFSEVYELWLEEKKSKKKKLAKLTFNVYRTGYNHLHELHDIPFSNIHLADIENVLKKYVHMSPSTMTGMMNVLHGMYKYALRHEIVDKDYSALVQTESVNDSARPHTPFTDEEVRLLWEHTDDPYVCYTLIMIYTGMRIGELLTMLSENVHLDSRYMIGGIKTDAGKNRIIPIHDDILPLISPGETYLLTNRLGRKFTYRPFSCSFNLAMERLGLSHTPHDTRHTCATKLEEAGVDPYHVKLILGHSVRDLTLGTYTHVKPEILVQDINKIKF